MRKGENFCAVKSASAAISTASGGGNLESKKNAIWLKTQKRFTNVKVLDAFNQNDTDEDDHDESQNKNSS